MLLTIFTVVLITILIVILFYLFKRYIRPRYPARVRCWFCGEKTSVPYGNRNCWDCPSCEQYNGFSEDGDYNKPIPAQYDERYNSPVQCEEEEYIGGQEVLCIRCSQNQLLKVKQLANFVPFNEKNYQYEVEAFEKHLEKVYRLCLACEIKVQQELQVQHEALAKRLSYQDHWNKSLRDPDILDERAMLHSSYSDREKNRRITASVVLHALSFSCSMSLALSGASQVGGVLGSCLLPLDTLLSGLEGWGIWLCGVGLFTGLAAKLVVGKYRLYIVDAVSCPIWLVVLLTYLGYLPLVQTGTLYEMVTLLGNALICGVCLSVSRKRRNQSNINVSRLSLDTSDSCSSVSSVSPYSSVSQVGTGHTDTYRSRPDQGEHKGQMFEVSPDDDEEAVTSSCQTDEEKKCKMDNGTIDNTASDFNAISLGTPSMRRTDSGVFSNVSGSSFLTNLKSQSVSEYLRQQRDKKPGSVISPATFRHASTPVNHRSSPVMQHGLFSVPPSQSTPVSSSFTEQSSFAHQPHPHTSAFTSTHLFSSHRHSFMPERPTTPVVTSFGSAPFSSILSTAGDSPYIRPPSRGSFTATRREAVKKRPDIVDDAPFDTDDEDDRCTSFTSVTARIADSTTQSQPEGKSPLWYHQGLIGFVLGGSIMANIILVVQALWSRDT